MCRERFAFLLVLPSIAPFACSGGNGAESGVLPDGAVSPAADASVEPADAAHEPFADADTFTLGLTYTSRSPVAPFAALSATMAANLSACTTAANQHLFNYGGGVGASATVDRDYAAYDWSSVDSRVASRTP